MSPPPKKQPGKRNPPERNGASLYIHFPFCLYKCHYCDFNSFASVADQIPHLSYRTALLNEIGSRKKIFEEEGKHFFKRGTYLETIFWGGGTPSLMRPADLSVLLDVLGRYFRIDRQTEITLEANPKTVTASSLAHFKSAGVNRLSLGVQSLNDSYLGRFGRIHSVLDARAALRLIEKTHFDSWNADLIFGFPGQTFEEWKKDLAEIVSFGMPHLSCYAFTVEEESPYGKMVSQGRAERPSDAIQAEMFEFTPAFLGDKGLSAYEISNFAKPDHECRHNLNYWRYNSFLGLGAGAVSFFKDSTGNNYGYRIMNVKSPKKYMSYLSDQSDRSDKKFPWLEEEKIDFRTAQGEFMMMGLRLAEGINPLYFRKKFDTEFQAGFGQIVERHRQEGLMEPKHIRLTKQGRLFSNQVMSSFFP